MRYPLFRLLLLMLLLLPFTAVKADGATVPSKSGIQKAVNQQQTHLKDDHNAAGLLAEINLSVHFPSISRPESSPATIFAQNQLVIIPARAIQAPGNPRNRVTIPVERLLLFPFHGFW